MDEESVDPDPMTQLSRWLEVARTAGEPMPEAMSVATATTDGRVMISNMLGLLMHEG